MARGGSLGGRGGSRAVSMRDAEEDPPSDRGDGRCCIAWDIEGQNLVTSTSHAHFFFHSSSSGHSIQSLGLFGPQPTRAQNECE